MMPESQNPHDQIPEWVSKVRAICIDTNALGKGRYNAAQLRDLCRQAEVHGGLEVWIAEPVVWEWADHLREDRASFNQARSKLQGAGIAVDAQPPEVDQSLEFVLTGIKSMGQHVKIIPIGPVAVEALKDQILVRSPGERISRDGKSITTKKEKSVKTGAADSAIFRAYHHQAKGATGTYIILSADSDVAKAHEYWGFESVLVVSRRSALNEHIFRMIPAPKSLVIDCATYLYGALDQLDLTSFESRTNLGGWYSEDKPASFAATGSKILAGLSGAQLDKKSQLITAEACIMTDVLGPEYAYVAFAEGHEEAGSQRAYLDTAIYVGVTFSVDKGVVAGVMLGDVRYTAAVETAYEESWGDEPQAILGLLTDVPGLESFEWTVNFYEDAEIQVELADEELNLQFDGSSAQAWTLCATYRGESVQIFGTRQFDGMSIDGIPAYGSTRLSTDSKLLSNCPTLAINALLMTSLVTSKNYES